MLGVFITGIGLGFAIDLTRDQYGVDPVEWVTCSNFLIQRLLIKILKMFLINSDYQQPLDQKIVTCRSFNSFNTMLIPCHINSKSESSNA